MIIVKKKPLFMNMSNAQAKALRPRPGFSLAEVLAAVTIGAMILLAVLGIYSRAQRSANAITAKLDNALLPTEVLQRIAEDLDKIIVPSSDTTITVNNKLEKGYQTAQLVIHKTIRDKSNKNKTLEEIIWQTSYDYDTDSLVLYRSYSGMLSEDKLLDERRESWEQEYPFVPICPGVTFFKIQASRGEDLVDRWAGAALPKAVIVTISFAEPYKTVTELWDVPDEEKITRTVTIDRTRKISFAFEKREDEQEQDKQPQEPNQPEK